MNTKQQIVLNTIKNAIYKKLSTAKVSVLASKEPIPFSQLKGQEFRQITVGDAWSQGRFCCGWLKFCGDIPQSALGKHIVLLVDICGEGLTYDNEGKCHDMVSFKFFSLEKKTFAKNTVEICENYDGTQKVDILMDAGCNMGGERKRPRLRQADICEFNPKIRQLYFAYLGVCYLMDCIAKEHKKQMNSALDKSFAMFRQGKIDDAIDALNTILIPADKDVREKEYIQPTIYAVGHAHLDLAWLWPIRETKRKAQRTLTNALNHINDSDDYIFGLSQPQILEWVKQENKDLYDRVAEQINAGRIELQGGLWVESDCNLTSGESLVRQGLYGQEFYKKTFDKQVGYCWLPDCFGFNGNLPQILSKSGMKNFATIKLSWNKHNKLPYTSFVWQGIDGSEVVAHCSPENNYNSELTPKVMLKSYYNNLNKDVCEDFLITYGIGDGGGGAGVPHVAMADIQKDVNLVAKDKKGMEKHYLPRIKKTTTQEFFDRLNTVSDKLPVHKGELYLEYHQGTYTTQAKNKLNNRLSERKMHNLEFLATHKYLLTKQYPHEFVDKTWREILLYQFHDVLPGSSISRVYKETDEAYSRIFEDIAFQCDDILQNKVKKVSVINPTGFYRREWLEYGNDWYKVEIAPYSAKNLPQKTEQTVEFIYDKNFIENDKVKVVFGSNGNIISYYDKENNYEICKGKMNEFVIYHDLAIKYNAWNINENYAKLGKMHPRLIEANVLVEGMNIVRINKYKFQKTTIVQRIVLEWNDDCLKFETYVDWNVRNKMLRVEFEPSVYADKVKCDIQFGYYERATTENNSIEKAQFEIPAQKYIDLDNGKYGLALLNDCKYGHRVKNGKISLNLLRSTFNPAPKADLGEQRFTYMLCPHKQRFEHSDVVKKAYMLNNPLLIVEEDTNFDSMVSVSNSNIIVETIKKAQDKDAIVVRAYNNSNCNCTTMISSGFDYKKASECNLLEQQIASINSLDNVEFGAFEIKTIMFEL